MRKEKIRNEDYSQRERPLTRSKQFLDIFKHRFLELLKLSLLQTVFNMPLLVTIFFFWMLLGQASSTSDPQGSMMMIFLIQGATFLVSLPISFVGLTGSFYALKKLVYAEGEFASSSFFYGLKEEWKKGLALGVIAGLSCGIAVIGIYFFLLAPYDIITWVKGFGIAIVIIQLIVVLMISYYSVAQVVVYKNNLRFILRNSFLMVLMRFPINLGLLILYPGGFIALVCIMPYTMYAGLALMIISTAFGHLVWILNAISAFDKYINQEKFPDYYRKGLAQQETKEE